jgi:hypothetical protein
MLCNQCVSARVWHYYCSLSGQVCGFKNVDSDRDWPVFDFFYTFWVRLVDLLGVFDLGKVFN